MWDQAGFTGRGDERQIAEEEAIKDNAVHLLYSMVDSLRSRHSLRLLQPKCAKEHYSKSFLPDAIGLYKTYIVSRAVC